MCFRDLEVLSENGALSFLVSFEVLLKVQGGQRKEFSDFWPFYEVKLRFFETFWTKYRKSQKLLGSAYMKI